VPASLAYDALRVVAALSAGRRSEAAAIVRGTRAFVRLLPGLLPSGATYNAREWSRMRTFSASAPWQPWVRAAREWRRLAGLPISPGV